MTSKKRRFHRLFWHIAHGRRLVSILVSCRPLKVLAAWVLILGLAACNSATETPKPIFAVISRVDNRVYLSLVNQTTPLPASTGMGLSSGSTITTGEQSDAVIDLGAGNAAYLESNTAMTLLRITPAGQGTEADLRLDAGRFLAIMPAGRVHIATLLAQVNLIGGAGMVEYAPGKLGLQDAVFTLSCLAAVCTVNSRVYGGDLGRNERLTISGSGLTVDRVLLSADQVSALLDELQYGASVAATLTAWPAGAASQYAVTPTQPVATSTAALPTRTLAPALSTATPTILPTETATPELTATPTPTPTLTLGPPRRPTVTATSTDAPSETLPPPTATSTDTPQSQPHPQPSATAPASPTSIPPSQTPPPSSTPVPPSDTPLPLPPTKTAVGGPTKTPQP